MKGADSNPAGSEETRQRLMRTAEHLFAELGLENVSVRAIVRGAGQKNESALQYHFGNKGGLITALQQKRSREVDVVRAELLAALRHSGNLISLRDQCLLMVKPPFILCRRDPGFREYIGVFGQVLLSSSRSVTETLAKGETEVLRELRGMLRRELKQLDDQLFAMRFENAARFATLAMSRRARDGESFRGRRAELFLSDLIDTLAGILKAPVSAETKAQLA